MYKTWLRRNVPYNFRNRKREVIYGHMAKITGYLNSLKKDVGGYI